MAGRIVGAQKLPAPGATVTIVSPQGPKAVTTDPDDRFYAAYLTPGRHDTERTDLQREFEIDPYACVYVGGT